MAITGISADGKAIVFRNIPYIEGEDGPRCVVRVSPQISKDAFFYLKDGSTAKELEYLNLNFDEGGNTDSVRGFYGNDLLVYSWRSHKFESVSVLNPETSKITKLIDLSVENLASLYNDSASTDIFVSPGSNIAVYDKFKFEPDISGSEIGLVDYKTKVVTPIVRSNDRNVIYQGIELSPNAENFIYRREEYAREGGITKLDFYVYSIKTGKSNLLPFSSNYGRLLSVLWKDDNSFVYRFPLQGGFPSNDPGVAMLFDLSTFKSKLLFGSVSEIATSKFGNF